MAVIIHLLMCITMFAAAIRLRYTQPMKLRPFCIPGGNYGIWLVAAWVWFVRPSHWP
jgi:hypothetical protein